MPRGDNQTNVWTYTDDIADLSEGLWDDFDGAIEIAQYEQGDYGAQLFILVKPEPYEFEARGIEMPEEGEDTGLPRLWWGMGGEADTYTISNDGFDIIGGPRPTRRTKWAEGSTRLMKALPADVKAKMLKSPSLAPLNSGEPVVLHWKYETKEYSFKDRVTGKQVEGVSSTLYPMPVVGSSNYAQSNGAAPPAKTTTRRSRKAVVEESAPAVEEDSPLPDTDNTEEDATEILATIIGEFADAGVVRSMLGTVVLEHKDTYGTDIIKEVAKRATVNDAIKAGLIMEEDGRLYKAD